MNAERSDVDASHYFASLGSVFSHGMHVSSYSVTFVYYSENCVFKLMCRGLGLKTSVSCGLQNVSPAQFDANSAQQGEQSSSRTV